MVGCVSTALARSRQHPGEADRPSRCTREHAGCRPRQALRGAARYRAAHWRYSERCFQQAVQRQCSWECTYKHTPLRLRHNKQPGPRKFKRLPRAVHSAWNPPLSSPLLEAQGERWLFSRDPVISVRGRSDWVHLGRTWSSNLGPSLE